MGYDYIALHGLVRNGILSSFGHQIGVGKESNIYIVTDDEEKERCLKIHRLVLLSILVCLSSHSFLILTQNHSNRQTVISISEL